MLAGSEFGKKMMRSAFRYKGELLTAGGPRNDALLRNDPARKADIRAKLGVQEGTRLLVYCPHLPGFGRGFRHFTAPSTWKPR